MAECKPHSRADQEVRKRKKRQEPPTKNYSLWQELPYPSDDSCYEDKTHLEFEDLRPHQKQRENHFLALFQHGSGAASDRDGNLDPAQDCAQARPRPIDLEEVKVDPKQKKRKKIWFWRKKSSAPKTKVNSDHSSTADTNTGPTRTQPGASSSYERDDENQRNEAVTARTSAWRKQLLPRKRLHQVAAAGKSNIAQEKGDGAELNGAWPAAACGAQSQTSDSSHIAPHGPATTEGAISIGDADPWLEDHATADEEEHTCAICYEIMVRPHSVRPCGHKFCEACLCQLHITTAKFSRDLWCTPKTDVLVLCPICRGGITKCEMDIELDTAIRATYPDRYNKRLKILQNETRKVKGSRLPSYSQKLPKALPPAGRRGRGRGAAAPQNNRIRNPRGPPLLTCINLCRTFGKAMAIYFGLSLAFAYGSSVIISTGLVKLCFRAVGRSGLCLTPERGPGAVGVLYLRGLGVGLLGLTVTLMFTLSWWRMLGLSLFVNSLAVTGYTLDGQVSTTLYRVLKRAFVRP